MVFFFCSSSSFLPFSSFLFFFLCFYVASTLISVEEKKISIAYKIYGIKKSEVCQNRIEYVRIFIFVKGVKGMSEDNFFHIGI